MQHPPLHDPPVWCPAFRLSSSAEHAKACTPYTPRHSTLRVLTRLCAAALFTHAAYAAKSPPPPPPPPPTSGTLVLDYLGQEGTGAEGFGLTVAPSGSIYASGISDSPSHGVVLASSDGGNSWSLADVFAPPGRYTLYTSPIAVGTASHSDPVSTPGLLDSGHDHPAMVWSPTLITGISMLPTLHGGQIIGINKLAYVLRPPQRGDKVNVGYRGCG